MATYIHDACELVRRLDNRMGPSPYDIAWMARVREPGGGPRWPDLLDWLVEHQHPDGSWGGHIVYYHDRMVCTLAAAIALQMHRDAQGAEDAVARAEGFLWHHLHLLPRDPFELVGFELVFPTLLDEARRLGIDVPSHACGYGRIQTEKLRLIPPEMLYSPRATTVHSLEFLGPAGDPEKMRKALAVNGSLGNSPAATAYYLSFRPDDADAVAYLEAVRRHMDHIIYLYPFRSFETAWVLNNLDFSGHPVRDFADDAVWDALASSVESGGVGLDSTFGIPDADTTAVSLYLLLRAGVDVDERILAQFENAEQRVFRTYHFERNLSVSTNVHALATLRLLPDYPNREEIRRQIAAVLLERRVYNVYWTDKWHASPYYATSHALSVLVDEGRYLAAACEQTVDWLIHTQHADGSWGFFQRGTAEETAYVLTALLHVQPCLPVDVSVLQRGVAYLAQQRAADQPRPDLWLGKDLYKPIDVVESAILGALMAYENRFGAVV